MTGGLNRAARQHEHLAVYSFDSAMGIGVFDTGNPLSLLVHEDSGHCGFSEQCQVASTEGKRDWRVSGCVLGVHFAASHAMPAVVTYRPIRRVRFGWHGLALSDELHFPPLRLEALHSPFQKLLRAAQRNGFLKLAIGKVIQTVL